ncbi:MAG: AI-2E family transporter [Nannocystaceae bacterium]|nr:AI-2E family transporter [bacterium]
MQMFQTPRRRRLALTTAAILVVLVVFTVWPSLTRVLLVAFASILGAILLDAPARWIAERTPLPRRAALAGVVLASVGLVVGLGFLVGPRLAEQFSVLEDELPGVFRELVGAARDVAVLDRVLEMAPSPQELVSGSKVVGNVATMFASALGGLAAGGLMMVLALFIAINPSAYVDPASRLIPPPGRVRAREIGVEVVTNLRHWLVARLLSMVAVAVLTSLGLWAIGVPAPASLGLIAGALSFIPNLGSLIGSLFGIAFAFAISPMTALWAMLVYGGVQFIEGNFITPLAERRAVDLPPAFLLCGQLLLGLLMGVLGLLVATPLLVVGVILVRRLYVDPIERKRSTDAPPTLAAMEPEPRHASCS